jgi:phosphoribosylglycinamide formyltransferase-1
VTAERKLRVGVVGSGRGSNFVAIVEACAAGAIPAEVVLVLSDVIDAPILQRARERNIPARFIAPGKFRTKLEEASRNMSKR